jgi:chromosome segregation ATPase
LKQTTKEFEITVVELNNTIKSLKKDLFATKQQLKQLEIGAYDSDQSRTRELQNLIDHLRSDHSEVEIQLNEHISRLNQQITTAANTIAENEKNIAKLQKQIHANNRVIAEKSEQLTQREESKNAEIIDITARARLEKEGLVQSYETAFAELTKQCNGHRKDLETVSRELAESESRNQKAKSLIIALKHERLQLQNEVESLTSKAQRDAEVSRAMIRNAELTAHSTATHKLHDAKACFENEKRRLFSLAADEFRTFFNAADSIDERSYRLLLGRVKSELKRLSESDGVIRRLIGVGPRQSTDQAVAHLIAP